MKKYVLAVLVFSFSVSAMENQLNICTKDEELRAVEISYLGDKKFPCKVNYTRSKITKTLWQAQYNAGYCEEKAKEFVDKLKRSGWHCRSVLGEPKQ